MLNACSVITLMYLYYASVQVLKLKRERENHGLIALHLNIAVINIFNNSETAAKAVLPKTLKSYLSCMHACLVKAHQLTPSLLQ